MCKTLSIFVSILFLYSNIAMARPQFCLRQQAAIERDSGFRSGIGLDGRQYKEVEVKVDPKDKEESERRLTELRREIQKRAQERGSRVVSGLDAVRETEWLLSELINRTNCSDLEFKANMPTHMQEMPGIVRMLTPAPSPELLIASMLHDGDRFFDGYYVMIEHEPHTYSDLYRQYYKPIQHPRMAADFVRPLLELLGIDEGIVQRVDVLIRNHETGLVPGRADSELVSDSGFLRDADSISTFTPVLLVNSLKDYRDKGREGEFYHEVHQKYTRSSPQARAIIDRLMQERQTEYLETQEPLKKTAYWVFMRIKEEITEGYRGDTYLIVTLYLERIMQSQI